RRPLPPRRRSMAAPSCAARCRPERVGSDGVPETIPWTTSGLERSNACRAIESANCCVALGCPHLVCSGAAYSTHLRRYFFPLYRALINAFQTTFQLLVQCAAR